MRLHTAVADSTYYLTNFLRKTAWKRKNRAPSPLRPSKVRLWTPTKSVYRKVFQPFGILILWTEWISNDFTIKTRMHSSRMRTGRMVTVFRKLEDPPENLEQAPPPKIWSRHHPPRKFGADTPPRKFGADTPPKIWSRHPPRKFGAGTPPKIWSRHPPPKIWSRHPPRKFGAGTPPKIWSRHPPPRKFGAGTPPENLEQAPPPCEQNSWHTLVKILPWQKLRFGR